MIVTWIFFFDKSDLDIEPYQKNTRIEVIADFVSHEGTHIYEEKVSSIYKTLGYQIIIKKKNQTKNI
jgi:hypothetical protein